MRTYDVMVDIDEVLCPTIDTAHQIGLEFGYHDGSEPVRIYKAWEQYGIPEEAYWELWGELALRGHYQTMPPIPGSVEALRLLAWEGHRIHLVTARGFLDHGAEIRDWTDEWVHENAVPHETLSYASDKVAIQQDLDVLFDFAIDDRFGTVEKLQVDGVRAYLMHHSHNAVIDTEFRVYTMQEFVDIVLEEAS
jgi:5' nucleotidase, deoxy (Pyrimidine), cytosolic type C protein (NT5C)